MRNLAQGFPTSNEMFNQLWFDAQCERMDPDAVECLTPGCSERGRRGSRISFETDLCKKCDELEIWRQTGCYYGVWDCSHVVCQMPDPVRNG